MNTSFDCIIVGGGMVGAALALALCKQNKSVALIERHLPKHDWLSQAPLRVSAINRFSEDYLSDLGLWRHIGDTSKCVFKQLATWEHGVKPLVFDADEIEKTHLGYLIRNEALQIAAYDEFDNIENKPQLFTDMDLVDIVQDETQASVILKSEKDQITLSASLIVGADGAFSKTRQLAGLGISGWDYQQHCLSITIKTDFETQAITWQEFQPSGPKAFLPLANGYSSLIWYDAPEKIRALSKLDNNQMKLQILEVFPPLAGDFEVVQQASFGLTRRRANHYFNNRVVLVGDAAHTINPLAGQGVNLGYKDVSELAKQVESIDLTDLSMVVKTLKQYQLKRKADSLVMSGAMDGFYKLFSNDKAPLKFIRSSMLNVANQFDFARKQVLKKAIGY